MILDQMREREHCEGVHKEQSDKEFRCRPIASNWEGCWCKKLARKKSQPKPEEGNRRNIFDIGKTLPSIPCVVPETPRSSATYPKTVHSSTSTSTERMRLPAFPTAEISVTELHFSILLLNYDARGYDFCFYLNLLFKSSFNDKKMTILSAKKFPNIPAKHSLFWSKSQNSSKSGFLWDHNSAF